MNKNTVLSFVVGMSLVFAAFGNEVSAVVSPDANARAKSLSKGPVKAEEVRARDGIGHVMQKIAEGKTITVAYLGGSITEMNGWRNMTTEWLRQTYPGAAFKEVNAGIGGTGSELGVYRAGWDALRHDPDLLFVEFATNDRLTSPAAIWRQMEGIVRQTWAKNPETDIVFVYTIIDLMTKEYLAGNCCASAAAMEALADHYGIPSVNFGPRVAALLAADKLVMGAKDFATAVPKEDPEYDRKVLEARQNDKRLLFSNDGVHPRREGHELYWTSVTNAITQMRDLAPVSHAAKMRTPFVADNYEKAKLVPITESMLSGEGWHALGKDDEFYRSFAARTMDAMHEASRPGDTLRFKFRGTHCLIYDLLGPDGGQVWVSVDGKRREKPVPRFDCYCTYHRLASLWICGGVDDSVVHTVEITVDKDQPDRRSVVNQLKDPEKELASRKYNGTFFRPGVIMLVGDIQ